MKRLILNRDLVSGEVTHGRLSLLDAQGRELFSCFTLELPWRDNRIGQSCIPPGQYRLVHRTSPKFGRHIHVLDVPGRTFILIHPANFVSQLRGCIAPGMRRAHLDGDQILDLASSRLAMDRLLSLIEDNDILIIT